MLLVVVCDDNKRCYNSPLHSHHHWIGIKKTGCVLSHNLRHNSIYPCKLLLLKDFQNQEIFFGNIVKKCYKSIYYMIMSYYSNINYHLKFYAELKFNLIVLKSQQCFNYVSITKIIMRLFYEVPVIGR